MSTPTIGDVLALTAHFEDLMFDACYPHGAERDETGDPAVSPDDFRTEAIAVANAVAPYIRVVDGQFVPARRDTPTSTGCCPTCQSPRPELHPALQSEGEVEHCRDPWHHGALLPVAARVRVDGTLERAPGR